MRFATRVFLTTALVSSAGILAGSSLVYISAEQLIRHEYEANYRERLDMVARDFLALEKAYDHVGMNAAMTVREQLRRGSLSKKELEKLKGELGVWTIELVKPGTFPEGQTPFKPDRLDPTFVAQYTDLTSFDRKVQIDVGIHISEAGKMIQDLVEDETDFLYVALRNAAGVKLAELARGAGASSDATTELHTQTPGGYEFTAQISRRSLQRSLEKLRVRFAAIFFLMILLSLGVSRWISNRLTKRIAQVRQAMDQSLASLPVSEAGDEIDALTEHYNRLTEKNREAQKAEVRAAVAAQVAHDIRSPLTSMMLAFNQLREKLPPEDRGISDLLSVLSTGISRVNGIVNRISGKKSQTTTDASIPVEAPRLTLVDKLLLDVANEHALKVPRTQSFVISGFHSLPKVWAVVQVTELQTALSNLLNNAFEAVPSDGRVELSAVEETGNLRVSIRDSGVGIPSEIIERVFEREFTSGKVGGSGLGLYQAKKAVEWGGGKISIQSERGKGTLVSLTVPTEKRPSWVTDEIVLGVGEKLVAVDDDPSILSAWRTKAREAGATLQEFQSFSALESAWESLSGPAKFILDQYAQTGGTGLDFVEKHSLGDRAFLSTSEFDDPAIQTRLKKARARMIPKPLLSACKIIVLKG